MDVFDRAQELDTLFRAQALKAHFVRRGQGAGGRDQIRDCVGCGEEIDPARIKANPDAVRCVGCQAKTERSARLGST